MNSDSSKRLFSEIEESIDVAGICAVSCPYLGSNFDRATAMAYPAPGNRCYRHQTTTKMELDFQRSFCLSDAYAKCEIYQGDTAPAVETNAGNGRLRKYGWKMALPVIIVLLLFYILISWTFFT